MADTATPITEIKTQSMLEAEWFQGIADYLYIKDGNDYKLDSGGDYIYHPESFVAKYREYCARNLSKHSTQPGAMKINDIWFSIPPQSIHVAISEKSIDIPQIRSKHSVQLDTGYGEVSVDVSLIFADNLIDGTKLEDEINFKLMPLLTQLKNIPFCKIENDHVRLKLLQYAEEITGQKVEDVASQTIMLTYTNHSISTSEESPRIIQVNLSFLLFNYLPFVDNISYVRNYNRTNGLLDRDSSMNNAIMTPKKKGVYQPEKSQAFYEFNTPELKRFHDNYFSPDLVNHEQNLEFTWYTYLEIPRSILSPKELEKAVSSSVPQPSKKVTGMPSTSRIAPGLAALSRLDAVKDIIEEASAKYGIDKNLIKAIMKAESNAGDPRYMKSSAGAAGWMQLMPDTAREVGVTNRLDDRQAIMGGVKYFAKMLRNNSGDVHLALASYNAGYGNVKKYKGIPPFAETQNYVPKVLGYFSYFQALEAEKIKNGTADQAVSLEETARIEANKDIARTIPIGGVTYEDFDKGTNKANTAAPADETKALSEIVKAGKAADQKLQENVSKLKANSVILSNNDRKQLDSQIETERSDAMLTTRKALEDKLKELGIEYEFIIADGAATIAYVRMKNYYNPYMDAAKDIHILGFQISGGQNVPRIPLDGHRYATHQYMGGHISKFAVSILTQPILLGDELVNTGDKVMAKIQDIFNTVAHNTITFRSVSSLDGIGIKNDLINTLMTSRWFTLDDTDVQTHPEIPDASITTFTFTDYSRIKEHVEKAFSFNQEYQKTTRTFIHEVIQTAFKEAGVYIESIFAEKGELAWVTSYGDIRGRTKLRMQLRCSQQINAIYRAAMDALFGYIAAIDIAYGMKDTYKITVHIDPNAKRNAVRKDDPSAEIVLPNGSVGKSFSYDIIMQQCWGGTSAKRPEADNAIHAWANLYLSDLIECVPGLVSKYGGTSGDKDAVLKEFENLTKPAYLDFDLPSTINPDYYFYQPNKYSNAGVKKEELYGNSLDKFQETLEERWAEYDRLLRATEFWQKDATKNKNNILYNLMGGLDDKAPEDKKWLKTMTDGEGTDPVKIKEAIKEGTEVTAEVNGVKTTRNAISTNYATNALSDKAIKYIVENEGSILMPENTSGGFVVQLPAGIKGEDPKKNAGGDSKNLCEFIISQDAADSIFKRYLAYTDRGEYMKAIFKTHANKASRIDYSFDMAKCFPVYKIFILEEDDQSVLYPLTADFNDFYGLNAITEIRFIEHSDQPADLLMIRFLDITGRFTSARFKEYHGMETKNKATIDTPAENPFKGIMLKEGTRIQFRAGYSNNVNELEVKFNGQIVSIDGDRNEFSLVCQSYGTELVYEKKSPTKSEDITDFNAETKEILHWCITQPEVKHFGRWKLSDLNNMQFSKDNIGLNFKFGLADSITGTGPGYYIRQRSDGTTQRTWSWNKDEGDLNIIAPEEGTFAGLTEVINGLTEHPVDTIIDQIKSVITLDLLKPFTQMFTSYYINGQTLWDIIDEMTYRYPGYVAKVLPYGDRCTLFYGPLDAPYFYRPFKISEMKEVSRRALNDQTEMSQEIRNAVDDWNEVLHAWREDGGISIPEPIWRDRAESKFNDLKVLIEKSATLPEAIGQIREEAKSMLNTVKPFRKFIIAASDKNIITNNIKADYRDVYNKVEVPYVGTSVKSSGSNPNYKGTVTVQMNDFLAEEDLRSTSLDYMNCINEEGAGSMGGAYRYGVHELWRQSKNLYKGTINLVGDPSIRPFDTLLLYDHHAAMYGPVEVREHILTITPGEGMISSITPGMYSNINDMTHMGLVDTLGTFLSIDSGIDASSKWAYGILPAASFGAAAYSAGTVVAGGTGLATMTAGGIINATGSAATAMGLGGWSTASGAGLAALGPVGWGVAAATAAAFYSLGRKFMMLGKYREPIFLQPLMKNGIPFIVGMQHYKIGSAIEYYNHEWQLFTDGLDTFFTTLNYGMEALNGHSDLLFGVGNKQ